MIDIPPALKIAIDERLWRSESASDLRHLLASSGLGKELAAQASWSLEQFTYADSAPSSGDAGSGVTVASVLNPLSSAGKCSNEACRLRAVDDFMQTVALYCDFGIIPDSLTVYFALPDRLHDSGDYDSLFRDLQVLRRLVPLIREGIVRFGSPSRKLCEQCRSNVTNAIEEAASKIVESIGDDYAIECNELSSSHSLLMFHIPALNADRDHPLMAISVVDNSALNTLGEIGPSGRPVSADGRAFAEKNIADLLKSEISNLFFSVDAARVTRSPLLAGSRTEVLALGHLDRNAPSLAEIEDWERLRTVELPWTHQLSADEVIRLRNEAGTALPRLRELLRRRLAENQSNQCTVQQIIEELRAEALQVEVELDSLHFRKERNYRAGMSGLAMSFVAYGIASQSPAVLATSLAALLATLAHLRGAERDLDTQRTKLVAKPGYALLTARRILEKVQS